MEYVIIKPAGCSYAISHSAEHYRWYIKEQSSVNIQIKYDNLFYQCPEKSILIGNTKFSLELLHYDE